jgi:hypothetical protein
LITARDGHHQGKTMAKYLCVKDFVMDDDGEVAFKAGEVYKFKKYNAGLLVLVQNQSNFAHYMPYKAMSHYFHKIIK